MLPRLHIITNTTIQSRYAHLDLARFAFEQPGVLLQYRNKSYDAARDEAELIRIQHLADRHQNPLIINDDAALTFQVGAHGVHLGKEDGSIAAARALLGPDAIVGATVHSLAELDAIRGLPVDYIGVGPVYGTRSKATGLPDLGLEGLAAICAASPFPVIGIGGIRPDTTAAVLQAGCYGVAVIGAFAQSDHPPRVAKAFLEILYAHAPDGARK